jgi:hypothetical protein
MRPLTVVTGILLGSCLSIAVSLAAVLFIFFLLGDEFPRLHYEFRALVTSLLVFMGMTAISALSFYGMLIRHPQRRIAQLLLWTGLAATIWYYWP